MNNIYLVIRNEGNVLVSIMLNRSNNKYHFVNITKGHICPCAFESVEEAINDMQIKKDNGEIINFIDLENGTLTNIKLGDKIIKCERCGCEMPYDKKHIKFRTEQRHQDFKSEFWKVEYVKCLQCGLEIEIGTNTHRTYY